MTNTLESLQPKIVQLSDREHILLRSGMYFSGKKEMHGNHWFLNEDKFEYNSTPYIPGLIKIIYEVIDNAVDVAVKSNFKFGNKIDIDITETEVTVKDNGYGIRQDIDPNTKESTVVLAVGNARAGSNFDDSIDRLSLGTNGIGVYITNVYSKRFKCYTCDGNTKFEVEFINNAESYTTKSSKCRNSAGITGTIINFEPDLDKFEITSIDAVHMNIIKQRLIILAMTYPEIEFKFNGVKIKFKNYKQFVAMFGDNFEFIEFDNGFIAFFPTITDEFNHFTILNGQVLKNGGNHIEFINNKVINFLRDKFSKKYKDIKPSDIKNKLMLVALFRNFPNPEYTSQTKEELANANSHIAKYLQNVDFDIISAKIYKNTIISELITEMYRIKEEFRKQKDLQKIGKTNVRIKSDKYWAPIGNKELLFICEGDSARSGLMNELGRSGKGYFAIRGKMLNVLEAKTAKISNNEEIDNIIKILNTKILHKTLPTTGKFFKITDKKTEKVFTMHNEDSLKIGEKWIPFNNLTSYPSYIINEEISKDSINIDEYYGQSKVNQNIDISYDYIVAATDQDLDGCFTGDTSIKSIHGNSYTFKELVDKKIQNLWVYSKNSAGKMVPALATNPRITKYVNKIVELRFNEGTIRCTEDHLILLIDNTYKAAIDITPYDIISSIYFKKQENVEYFKTNRQYWKNTNEHILDFLQSIVRSKTANKYSNFYRNCQSLYLSSMLPNKFSNNGHKTKSVKDISILKHKIQFLNILYAMDMNNIEINAKNYAKYKNKENKLNWHTALNYFDSHEEALEDAKRYGYKIIDKKVIEYGTPIPVYDLTVEKYNNFLVNIGIRDNSGIIVHNSHIRALILTMFDTFLLPLLKAGKIKYLQTPLIALKQNNKIIKYFFNFKDYQDYITDNPKIKGEWKYYKGLGSWANGELKSIISKDGIDKFLKSYEYEENTSGTIFNWMSKTTADFRKEKILEDSISIDTV